MFAGTGTLAIEGSKKFQRLVILFFIDFKALIFKALQIRFRKFLKFPKPVFQPKRGVKKAKILRGPIF